MRARSPRAIETASTIETPDLLDEVYRLRHQVYCIERAYETSTTGRETDEFDGHSRHVVLRCQTTGDVIGTARLVLPMAAALDQSFPVQRVCAPALWQDIPLVRSAEVSRFALSKARRGRSAASAMFLRLGLVRGLVQLSDELKVTHWLAVMEPSLLRLLQTTSIHFQPVGPLVDHHGARQPAYGDIDAILARMSREQPEVWAFVTDRGQLWTAATDRAIAA